MPLRPPQSRPARPPKATAGTRQQARRPSRSPRTRSTPGAAVDDQVDVCEVQVVDPDKIARARAALPSMPTLSGLSEMLRALGDPTRLQIVCALATRGVDELCVCDLAALVGVSDSAVSHSLRTLRQLGLVRYRKVGKIAYYRLDDTHVGDMVHEGIQHLER